MNQNIENQIESAIQDLYANNQFKFVKMLVNIINYRVNALSAFNAHMICLFFFVKHCLVA